MAKKLSTLKRIRQNEKRRTLNKGSKSALKTQIKKLLSCMEEESVEKTRAEFLKTVSLLDRAGRKNILHKNNSARKKSGLQRKFNEYMALQKQKTANPTT